jgi:hypothetical protein
MRRIASYLALAIVLNMGALAQIIVAPPPEGFTPGRMVQKKSARIQDKNPPVSAIALDVQGSCKFSLDGKKFHDLKINTELPRKATVKTGSSGRTELFIKRMGATIRLEPNSEISLQRFQQAGKDEHMDVNTKVQVLKGKAITVVHANVPGGSLDLKNAGGKSLTDPVLGSRYVVTATEIDNGGPDGARVDFSPKMKEAIKEQMEFDELQALAEAWRDDENPGLEK